MKQKIVQWLEAHSITTHTIAIVYTGLTAAYFEVPAFASLVNEEYARLSPHAKAIVAAAIGLFAWYRNSLKKGLSGGEQSQQATKKL